MWHTPYYIKLNVNGGGGGGGEGKERETETENFRQLIFFLLLSRRLLEDKKDHVLSRWRRARADTITFPNKAEDERPVKVFRG